VISLLGDWSSSKSLSRLLLTLFEDFVGVTGLCVLFVSRDADFFLFCGVVVVVVVTGDDASDESSFSISDALLLFVARFVGVDLSSLTGRCFPCLLQYNPHLLHSVLPSAPFLHRGVFSAWQFAHETCFPFAVHLCEDLDPLLFLAVDDLSSFVVCFDDALDNVFGWCCCSCCCGDDDESKLLLFCSSKHCIILSEAADVKLLVVEK